MPRRSRRSRGARASFAAVPFFQPHQLVIVAIGRVSRVELGGERLVAGQPFARRVGEMVAAWARNRPAASPCPGDISACRTCRVLRQRPIFERLGSPVMPSKPPARRSGRAGRAGARSPVDRLLRGRLAGLVVDDRQAAVGEPVDAVGPAMEVTPASIGLAVDLGRERPPALGLFARSRSAIQSIASSSRGAHKARSIGWIASSPSSARRAAAACPDRTRPAGAIPRSTSWTAVPFHARAMVGVDRVHARAAEDRLGIESERIGLEPVDRGHRDPVRPLLGRRAMARAGRRAAAGRDRRAPASAVPAGVARQARRLIASSRSQKRDATVGELRSRRARVISTSRRTQRAGEIVRGKPDPEFEAGMPRSPDLRREPWIGRRQAPASALVEPAEDDQVGALQPRLEQAPDEDARMAAIGRAHACPSSSWRSNGTASSGADASAAPRLGDACKLGEQLGGHRARRARARPRSPASACAASRQHAGKRGQRIGDSPSSVERCRRRGRATAIARSAPKWASSPAIPAAGRGPRSLRSSARTASSQRSALIAFAADQRMLEQRQQRHRRQLLGRGRGNAEQQRARRRFRQRPAGAVVGLDPPAREQRRDPRGELAVGGHQRSGFARASRAPRAAPAQSPAPRRPDRAARRARIPLIRRSAGGSAPICAENRGAAIALATGRARGRRAMPPGPHQRHVSTSARATPIRSSSSFK